MAAGAYLLLPAQARPKRAQEYKYKNDARYEPYIPVYVPDSYYCDAGASIQALAMIKQIFGAIAAMVLGLVGVMLAGMGIITLMDNDITPEDLAVKKVSGTLAHSSQIRIYTNGEARSVTLELNEYPGYSFVISGDALEVTRYLMMKDNLVLGDSVFLQISRSDFEGDDEADEAPESMSLVEVFGARDVNQTFLTVENYCKKRSENTPWQSFALIIFGVLFMSPFATTVYRQEKHNQKNLKAPLNPS
jgi:hypothetical protein